MVFITINAQIILRWTSFIGIFIFFIFWQNINKILIFLFNCRYHQETEKNMIKSFKKIWRTFQYLYFMHWRNLLLKAAENGFVSPHDPPTHYWLPRYDGYYTSYWFFWWSKKGPSVLLRCNNRHHIFGSNEKQWFCKREWTPSFVVWNRYDIQQWLQHHRSCVKTTFFQFHINNENEKQLVSSRLHFRRQSLHIVVCYSNTIILKWYKVDRKVSFRYFSKKNSLLVVKNWSVMSHSRTPLGQ